MQLSIPTLVTLLLSAIIAPWFEQHDIPLTVAQQAKLGDWITAAIVFVATLAAHLIHGKVKQVQAAKAALSFQIAAKETAEKAAPEPVAPPARPTPPKTGPIPPRR